MFVADEVQVERALRNLMLNAVTFTNPGGRVEVAVRSDGPEIVIEVRDSGVGIPPEEQPHLFTRFFTASGERRRRWMGGGLGLYVVKAIVDGHGGSVDVVSEPGKGSTFTMRFPARPQRARRRASDRALGRAASAEMVVT